MEEKSMTKSQLVALMKDMAEMTAQGLRGLESGDKKVFLSAITQLEAWALLLGDVTEFPADEDK